MKSKIVISLGLDQEQMQRLKELQVAFACVCNALTPIVQQTRCWNRVALHHLAYRPLREQFPKMGSQMICNAIYSVSRTARKIYQDPQSPWGLANNPNKPLPLIKFSQNSPVYFDRHTLNIKDGQLSMFTLDGRIRFQVNMSEELEAWFINEKLTEVVLGFNDGGFRLSFAFGELTEMDGIDLSDELPEFVLVISDVSEVANGCEEKGGQESEVE